MRVVLDTNVILSALLNPGKARSLILELAVHNHQIILSEYIFQEIETVLKRNKFRHTKVNSKLLRMLRLSTRLVPIAPEHSSAQVREPKDHPILQTAEAAGADYLITGDKDLLSLGKFRGTMIVSLTDFSEVRLG